MGYAYYEFEDGHGPRGYSVEDVCAQDGCDEQIDRGLAYLCYGCTKYFCPTHLTVGFYPDGDTAIEFDCFAGQSSQCCLQCEKEVQAEQSKSNESVEQLIRVMDTISEPILTMSDADLIAECIEDGEDPEEISRQVKKTLDDAVRRIATQSGAQAGEGEG